ncbi:MAG: hypothetical protein ABFR89_00160 [Actinomycetota bacterium]
MTTAPGHGGVATVGPREPQRWVVLLAVLAITAVGIAAIAWIASDRPVTEIPAAPAPAPAPEVAPPVAVAPIAPAIPGPIVESHLSMQELAIMNEAATGLVPTGVLQDEFSVGVEPEHVTSALSLQELALMNEAATGLVPTGALQDEFSVGVASGHVASILSGEELTLMSEAATGFLPKDVLRDEASLGYAGAHIASALTTEEMDLMRATVSGWAPTGVLEDEAAVISGYDYSARVGSESLSPTVNALIAGEQFGTVISAAEFDLMQAAATGRLPTGVLDDEMAAFSGFDFSAIGSASISPEVNALISGKHLSSALSTEELDFMRGVASGLIPTGVLEQELE